VHHDTRRSHAYRDPQRKVRGRDLQRPQARAVLADACRGRDAGHARRPNRIGFDEPLPQVSLEIGAIDEAPLFEKRALDPPDQIFDAPFLLWTVRPAHLHADAEFEGDAGKRRIPFGDDAVAAPSERDRLRPIKHRDQGMPPKAARCSTNARTSVATRSSGTSETSIHREYFNRDAKKCIFVSVHR
jgi:hypothetical protein